MGCFCSCTDWHFEPWSSQDLYWYLVKGAGWLSMDLVVACPSVQTGSQACMTVDRV